MIRVRDTPVPYPYLLILNVATFIFVYSTPFLYNTGPQGRYCGVQLLIVAYYGAGSSICIHLPIYICIYIYIYIYMLLVWVEGSFSCP
jgi:hypothetical protein